MLKSCLKVAINFEITWGKHVGYLGEEIPLKSCHNKKNELNIWEQKSMGFNKIKTNIEKECG